MSKRSSRDGPSLIPSLSPSAEVFGQRRLTESKGASAGGGKEGGRGFQNVEPCSYIGGRHICFCLIPVNEVRVLMWSSQVALMKPAPSRCCQNLDGG